MDRNARRDDDGQPLAPVNRERNATKAVADLYGLCRGLLADGELTDKEVEALANWLTRHSEMIPHWPINVIAQRVAVILDDGEVSPEEASELQEFLLGAVGDPNEAAKSTSIPLDDSPPAIEFSGRSFCFTGKFQRGKRKDCQTETAAIGGVVQGDVTRTLDYLVIGTLASRDWVQSSHGRKIEAAVKHKVDGRSIQIISERHWAKCLDAEVRP